MRLKDIGSQEIVCIDPSATASEAAKMMKARHVGDLIVIEPNRIAAKPLGILTDRDLVTFVMAENIDPDSVQVSDIMARNLKVAYEEEDIHQVVQMMRNAGVRRLPILNRRDELVSVISIDDIYQVLADELNILASVSTKQVLHEEIGNVVPSRFI